MARHVRLIIRGRVQGVGFRAAAQREARRLGVVGFVRNLPDGAVEVAVSGTPDTVNRMIDWTRVGPRLARVDEVALTELDSFDAITFDVR